jgi:hypothetical protein
LFSSLLSPALLNSSLSLLLWSPFLFPLCSALLLSSLFSLHFLTLPSLFCSGPHLSSSSAKLFFSPHSSPLHFLTIFSLLCSGIHLSCPSTQLISSPHFSILHFLTISSLLCSGILLSSPLFISPHCSALYCLTLSSTLEWNPSLLPPLLSSSYLLTHMLCIS